MSLVGSTPFGGLMLLFAAVPLGILIVIYAGEHAGVFRHRFHPFRRH